MILTGLYYEEACLFVPTPYFHPTIAAIQNGITEWKRQRIL